MNCNDRTAILVASFGTTHLDALARCIAATEHAIAARFPEHPVYRAFTSGMVIRRLKERHGIAVDTVAEALARMEADGFRRAAVQPTLLLGGIEYEQLAHAAQGRPGLRTAVGRPLLADAADCAAIASILMAENPLRAGDALLLMGHGTEHTANDIYRILQETFDQKGYRAFLGTVEGTPSFADAVSRLSASGATRAKLLPLLFVAGDHAKNDMAGGQEGSFLQRALAAGVQAEPILRGLGESEAVQALYAERAAAALREVMR